MALPEAMQGWPSFFSFLAKTNDNCWEARSQMLLVWPFLLEALRLETSIIMVKPEKHGGGQVLETEMITVAVKPHGFI